MQIVTSFSYSFSRFLHPCAFAFLFLRCCFFLSSLPLSPRLSAPALTSVSSVLSLFSHPQSLCGKVPGTRTTPEKSWLLLNVRNSVPPWRRCSNLVKLKKTKQKTRWPVWLLYLVHVGDVESQIFGTVEQSIWPFHLNSFPNFRRTQVDTISTLKAKGCVF